jgi:phage gp29-like protein
MPLLDQFGRPIDVATLTRQVSAPTITGVRAPTGGHPADGLRPERLAAILRAAETGDTVAYLELAEQMEEKDLHYLGVLGTRKRAVAQLEATVEAAGTSARAVRDADLIRDWLTRDTLQDELFDMLDALGKGFSYIESVWATTERQWMIDRLVRVDPRHVDFNRTDMESARLLGDDGLPMVHDPLKFMLVTMKAKSGLPIRSGLARPVSWMWMFKNFAVKDWLAFADVYGLPFRVGKYGPDATPENRTVLLRAVREIGSDAAAIIPKSMEIEFITAASGSGGDGLFAGMADFFDRQVSKGVLGQTATTDADTGGLGSGKEHGEVRQDIRDADAAQIAAPINRWLVRPLIDFNHGPPEDGRYPRVSLGRAESWDAPRMMPAVRMFVEIGGRVSQAEIRDKLGLSDPAPDEPLLAPSQPPAESLLGTPAEPPQKAPADLSGGSVPAQAAANRFLRLLKPLTGQVGSASSLAIAAATATAPRTGDEVDALAALAAEEWEAVMTPIVGGLADFLEGCADLDDARARLAEAMAAMDTGPLTERLAQAAFVARLAGLTDPA